MAIERDKTFKDFVLLNTSVFVAQGNLHTFSVHHQVELEGYLPELYVHIVFRGQNCDAFHLIDTVSDLRMNLSDQGLVERCILVFMQVTSEVWVVCTCAFWCVEDEGQILTDSIRSGIIGEISDAVFL